MVLGDRRAQELQRQANREHKEGDGCAGSKPHHAEDAAQDLAGYGDEQGCERSGSEGLLDLATYEAPSHANASGLCAYHATLTPALLSLPRLASASGMTVPSRLQNSAS